MYILLGSPGAGKSTQAQLLADRLDFYWISTGNLARQIQDPAVKKRLADGELLSDDEIKDLLEAELAKVPQDKKVILDGYPRNDKQIDALLNDVAQKYRPVTSVVYLKISQEQALERLIDRGRPEDTLEVAKFRIDKIFNEEIEPILKELEDAQIPVIEVSGLGAIEQVYDRLVSALNQ